MTQSLKLEDVEPARVSFLYPSIGGDELIDPIGRTLLCLCLKHTVEKESIKRLSLIKSSLYSFIENGIIRLYRYATVSSPTTAALCL
jgi:hypothetical protein